MAKQSAAEVEGTQHSIPKEHRPFIRLSDDGKTTFFTFSVPTLYTVEIRAKEEIVINVSKLNGVMILLAIFARGIRRLIVDGTKGSVSKKNKKTGNVETIKYTEKQKQDIAREFAHLQIKWLLGDREKSAHKVSVDPVTAEAIAILCTFICKSLVQEGGKKYTMGSVPSFVVNARNTEMVKQAARELGITKKSSADLIKQAELNVERSDRSMSLSVSVDTEMRE